MSTRQEPISSRPSLILENKLKSIKLSWAEKLSVVVSIVKDAAAIIKAMNIFVEMALASFVIVNTSSVL